MVNTWLNILFRIVVGGIQMAEILMQKLPDVFHVYFRREGNNGLLCIVQLIELFMMLSGVMHSMNKLTNIPLKVSLHILYRDYEVVTELGYSQ